MEEVVFLVDRNRPQDKTMRHFEHVNVKLGLF